MKFITSTLVMALFLASGEDLASMKMVAAKAEEKAAAAATNDKKPRFAQLDSESDSDSSDSSESDEDVQLGSDINMTNNLMMQHRSKVVQDINAKVKELDELLAANDDKDENWQQLSLSLISHLQDPIHNTILSWNDWWMSQNAAGHPTTWDPVNNPFHLIKAEVSDVYKAMTKIRMLEKKLAKEGTNSGTTNADWNMLNSLKRELGIPVEFAGDKAQSLAGDGAVPTKVTAAFM